MSAPGAAALAADAPRFARGASARHGGVRLAYAFRADGPPGQPDPFRWWLLEGDDWRLFDIRLTCAHHGFAVPWELTNPYFSAAYADWLFAVARTLAAISHRPAPPLPQYMPHPAPRLWWMED